MRRAALAVVAAFAAVGCGSASSAPSETAAPQATSSLTISFWSQGSEQGGEKRWTLRCGPAGGTHPRKASACSKLLALKAPFAPTPKDVACIQIYGGPQQARVTGTHRGRPVDARLSLRDGCEIDRFKRVAFLVPGFAVGASGAGS